MTTSTQTAAQTIALPSILTANTYFWHPATSASGRRSNEARQARTVDQFENLVQTMLGGAGIGVGIDFTYNESCANVYKSVSYRIPGKTTNLTGFIGYCKRNGLILTK